jgi:N,N-dimethylformamidase beta subunit-like, C-terminal
VLSALLLLALVPAALAGVPPHRAAAPLLSSFSAGNGGLPWGNDSALLTTISSDADSLRRTATIRFHLEKAARVQVQITRTVRTPRPIWQETLHLRRGWHDVEWAPEKPVPPRTYLVRITATDAKGHRQITGAGSLIASLRTGKPSPVIRVLGIDAGFTSLSYAPNQPATLSVSADVPSLTVQFFHAGPEHAFTTAPNAMAGVPVGKPLQLGWSLWRDAPHQLRLWIGQWASGLYFAKLTSPDGDVGYAPFVVRPTELGEHRVAVVLPTMTWQAYNFRDVDGDGWGDTWYAGPPNRTARLGRPFLNRGVPPQYAKYDLGFLHWLAWTGKQVDYIADTDLDRIADGQGLANRYDLIVFPGHTEYVTDHIRDAIEQYRDLGGNLMFLSSNNFFWRITRTGQLLTRVARWRRLGRPEASLLGVQYLANDEGQTLAPYVVRSETSAPWLWDGTRLHDGDTFGFGFGIEIDATTKDSPPVTIVLADVPEIYGKGYTAQMTYYETSKGAKVFAAGTMNFGGSATRWPQTKMLDNLWARVSTP